MAAPQAVPPLDHAFVIVLENHGFDGVIGNKNMPNLNGLASTYGLAANYYGVGHPSLPNYVALISGDTFGSASDDPRQRFGAPNIATQLMAKGRTWRGYMQGLPRAGFEGNYNGLVYGKKHDPFMLSSAIADDPKAALNVVPLDELGQDLASNRAPDFALIAPDLCHDMHGGPTCLPGGGLDRTGDAFVGKWVGDIMASSVWTDRSLIVVTFDESENRREVAPNALDIGGHVATIVITKTGPKGVQSKVLYDHYALLRTLEDGFGLARLGHAAQAKPMVEFFSP